MSDPQATQTPQTEPQPPSMVALRHMKYDKVTGLPDADGLKSLIDFYEKNLKGRRIVAIYAPDIKLRTLLGGEFFAAMIRALTYTHVPVIEKPELALDNDEDFDALEKVALTFYKQDPDAQNQPLSAWKAYDPIFAQRGDNIRDVLEGIAADNPGMMPGEVVLVLMHGKLGDMVFGPEIDERFAPLGMCQGWEAPIADGQLRLEEVKFLDQQPLPVATEAAG